MGRDCQASSDPVGVKPSWLELLSQARDVRKIHRRCGSDNNFLSVSQFQGDFLCHFPALGKQVADYVLFLSERTVNRGDESNLLPVDVPKSLVLETRSALRFGLTCMTIGDPQQNQDSLRRSTQNEAVTVARLHCTVGQVLTQPGGDSKCRILSAQLLSNMVTSNFVTASAIAADLQISPSHKAVSSHIMNENDALSEMSLLKEPTEQKINWVDMMLTAVRDGNRNALEAIVAALHNCLAALRQVPFHRHDEDCSMSGITVNDFALKIAANNLLMSTLLRQVLSVDSIKESIQNNGGSEDLTTDSLGDATTEWILLVIERVCSLGLLPQMYRSLSGPNPELSVSPEHVVLLHCIERVVHDTLHSPSSTIGCHPLGGDGSVLSSNLFLAKQASLIRGSLAENDQDTNCNDFDCRRFAYLSVLEILASSLGVADHEEVRQSRLSLGSDTEILRDACHDMGMLVDGLSSRNRDRKARKLDMSDPEKQMITVLVRLLGNICFQCRQNQDLMRSTSVPFSDGDVETIDALSNSKLERTGLHVLLSCTSFSYGCFTLREWAIVAIRNILELNEENQALVQKLEAQQALNTPELQRMGVTVDLNRQGQVSVREKED